jgi:hypothetical protein
MSGPDKKRQQTRFRASWLFGHRAKVTPRHYMTDKHTGARSQPLGIVAKRKAPKTTKWENDGAVRSLRLSASLPLG